MVSTLVLKFGGAAVATPASFARVADLVSAQRQTHTRVVVAISAMGGMTDQLIDLAKQVHPHPPQREFDMLVSVGERISMSLLAMALCLKGQQAMSFTGSQSGIMTCWRHTEARIIDVRPQRLEEALDQGKIVIVAGFQGVSATKEITTLGRGGSDTSAVALGVALNAAQVVFFKDVPGVFDQDPKRVAEATCHARLTYAAALDIVERGAKVLHPRAIRLAASNGLPLRVRSFVQTDGHHPGTLIAEPAKERSSQPIYESES